MSALLDLLQGGSRKREPDDPRQRLYIALARVLSAAAWVDAPMTRLEENQIKSLVSTLRPRLTSRETKMLLFDLEAPVPSTLWHELLLQLGLQVKRRSQADFVVARVRDLLQVDGSLDDAERQILSQVEIAVRSLAEQATPGVGVTATAAGVDPTGGMAPTVMSLGAAASMSIPLAVHPGSEVLALVVADLRRSEDKQAADLRAIAAPLEKLCVFAAAMAFVLGPDTLRRGLDDRALSSALAQLFSVSASAAQYVLQRALAVVMASPSTVEGVAADLLEWSSMVECNTMLAALRSASLRPAASGRLDALEQSSIRPWQKRVTMGE